MLYLLYAITLVSGICNAVEPGQNATLSRTLHQPWLAAIITLGLNIAIFLAIALFRQDLSIPSAAEVRAVPWWAWLGGICSSIIVISQLFVSERIGAGRFVGVIVTVAIVTSIVLDNYALVGFERHPAGLWRIVGGLLMVGGVTLVTIF